MAGDAVFTIEVRGIVATVVPMMPGLGMAHFANAVIDRITVGEGVRAGKRREYHGLNTAVGCLHLIKYEIEIRTTKLEEIMTGRTTIDMMVLRICVFRVSIGQQEKRYRYTNHKALHYLSCMTEHNLSP